MRKIYENIHLFLLHNCKKKSCSSTLKTVTKIGPPFLSRNRFQKDYWIDLARNLFFYRHSQCMIYIKFFLFSNSELDRLRRGVRDPSLAGTMLHHRDRSLLCDLFKHSIIYSILLLVIQASYHSTDEVSQPKYIISSHGRPSSRKWILVAGNKAYLLRTANTYFCVILGMSSELFVCCVSCVSCFCWDIH